MIVGILTDRPKSGNAPGSHGTVGDLNTDISTFLMEYPQNQVTSNEN